MKKIAFIGVGSFGFTRTLVKDILTFPAFSDCEIALMDINRERLDYISRAVKKIVAQGNYPAVVSATQDRAKALEGADGVVITIQKLIKDAKLRFRAACFADIDYTGLRAS